MVSWCGRKDWRAVRCGMTLVEVLVATVLLGVGVSGLMLSATVGLRNQRRCEQRAAATFLAYGKLSEIEVVGPHMWSLGRPSSGTEVQDDVTYHWSVQIAEQGVGELYDVQVEVSWTDVSAGSSVTLQTLLNDYEAVTETTPDESKRKAALDANEPSPGR